MKVAVEEVESHMVEVVPHKVEVGILVLQQAQEGLVDSYLVVYMARWEMADVHYQFFVLWEAVEEEEHL